MIVSLFEIIPDILRYQQYEIVIKNIYMLVFR